MKKDILIIIVVILVAIFVFGAINKKPASKPSNSPVNRPRAEKKLKPEEIKKRVEISRYIRQGYKKMSNKDYQGAIDDCTVAIDKDTKNIGAYRCRAIAKTHIKDNDGALQDFESILSISPNDKMAELNIKRLSRK